MSSYDFDFVGKIGEADNCKKAIIVIAFFSYLMYMGVSGAIIYLQYK